MYNETMAKCSPAMVGLSCRRRRRRPLLLPPPVYEPLSITLHPHLLLFVINWFVHYLAAERNGRRRRRRRQPPCRRRQIIIHAAAAIIIIIAVRLVCLSVSSMPPPPPNIMPPIKPANTGCLVWLLLNYFVCIILSIIINAAAQTAMRDITSNRRQRPKAMYSYPSMSHERASQHYYYFIVHMPAINALYYEFVH